MERHIESSYYIETEEVKQENMQFIIVNRKQELQ